MNCKIEENSRLFDIFFELRDGYESGSFRSFFQYLAYDYNFDAVRTYFNNGNPINICDENGSSLLTAFLGGYANYGDNAENEEELLAVHDECDHGFWDRFLSEKQKTPLIERNGGSIVKQLDWFISNGADPKVWLFSADHKEQDYEKWLIEHMDVKMMESEGEKFYNELRIAALLAHYGLDDFNGICISIDKEKRIVSGRYPEVKF